MIQNPQVQHTLLAYLRHELCTPTEKLRGKIDA
jgi:hypothetical protein